MNLRNGKILKTIEKGIIHFKRTKPEEIIISDEDLDQHLTYHLTNYSQTNYSNAWFDPTRRRKQRNWDEFPSTFTGTKIDVEPQIKILKKIIGQEIKKHKELKSTKYFFN